MHDLLFKIPPWVFIALVIPAVILGMVAYLILLERKIASWVQDRLGPNRVGPRGLLQPIADGLKFVLKEDYRPAGTDSRLFTLAPAIMMLVMMVSIAVIPWAGTYQASRTFTAQELGLSSADIAALPAPNQPPIAMAQGTPPPPPVERVADAAYRSLPPGMSLVNLRRAASSGTVEVTVRYPFQIASLNIGVLFIIAVLSLAVYGIVIGGWASNNKYSFLGGLRATAQMISYEIPLGLSLLAIVTMFGTLDLGVIVEKQAHLWGGLLPAWNVFTQPLAFLLFLVCIHAEANRSPFDLAEAEQELVGGYHTEYSSMRFALFFLAEYAGMITTSAVCVALFFGGWHLPGLTGGVDPSDPSVTTSFGLILLRCLVYFLKIAVLIVVFMWVRWSLPRFRFDQLMMVAWRGMIPISLALVLATALLIYFLGWNNVNFTAQGIIDGKLGAIFFATNLAIAAITLLLSQYLPAAPDTNRRLKIIGSRFTKTPLPATLTSDL